MAVRGHRGGGAHTQELRHLLAAVGTGHWQCPAMLGGQRKMTTPGRTCGLISGDTEMPKLLGSDGGGKYLCLVKMRGHRPRSAPGRTMAKGIPSLEDFKSLLLGSGDTQSWGRHSEHMMKWGTGHR